MLSSSPTILEAIRKWALELPSQEALVFQSAKGRIHRLTYADLMIRIQKPATLFRQLPLHSRVGLIAAHGPDFLVEALAILAAGHCLVPINGQLSAGQRDELAERAGIHALRRSEKDGYLICTGKPVDQAADEDFRALLPAYLRFTSGSTGQRKGVLLSHRTILERTATANARLQISPADRVLCLLPMVDHFVVSILLYLRYGATILLVENDDLAPHLARSENATVLYGAPAQFRGFIAPLPKVRLAVSTTQGLSLSSAETFLKNTGKPMVQALGIIEAGLLTLNKEHAVRNPLLFGVPMPGYQLSVADKRGGEIHVSGPGLLDAYVSPWRPRASLLTENGLPTGDHGWIDQDGCLHLLGREKNRIDYEGGSLFYEGAEAIINQHPDVRESLVFQKQGQLFAQIVVAEMSGNKSALVSWIEDKLAFVCKPMQVETVMSLPRTPTGKLARPF